MIANNPLKNAIGFCLRMFAPPDPMMPYGVQLNLGPGQVMVLARGSRGCCQLVIPVVWHTEYSMFVLTRFQAQLLYDSLPSSGNSDMSFSKQRLVISTGVRTPNRIDKVAGHCAYTDWHNWFDVADLQRQGNYSAQHLASIAPAMASIAGPDASIAQGVLSQPLILTACDPGLGGFSSVKYALPSLPARPAAIK